MVAETPDGAAQAGSPVEQKVESVCQAGPHDVGQLQPSHQSAAQSIRPRLPHSDDQMEHSVSSEDAFPPIFLQPVLSKAVRHTQCYSGEGTRHTLDIPRTTVVS